MADNRFEFRYTANDVASAQRMRMFRSRQIRVLAIVWLVSSLFLAVPMLLPNLFPGISGMTWGLVVELALVYLVTMAILFAITPYLDFFFNRFWRMPMVLQFSDKQIRLSVSGGKSKGLQLSWKQIQRAEENQRVYILYYGIGNKFIILPKSIFKRPQDDRRFRDLLNKHLAEQEMNAGIEEPIKAETETAEESQPENS